MSKRLQVILNPTEFLMVKKISTIEKKSMSDWVRSLIMLQISQKKEIINKDSDLINSFRMLNLPSPPIEQMLEEIERGRI